MFFTILVVDTACSVLGQREAQATGRGWLTRPFPSHSLMSTLSLLRLFHSSVQVIRYGLKSVLTLCLIQLLETSPKPRVENYDR